MAANTQDSSKFRLVLTGDGLNIDRELDQESALAVMQIALGGGQPTAAPSHSSPPAGRRHAGTVKGKRVSKAEGSSKPKRRKGGPGLVRDLSLKPSGKTSLADFANSKNLKTHGEKQIAVVSWLVAEGGVHTGITLDHINTCYKHLGWKRPADLENSLQKTASQKGWLDTAHMSDIKLTVHGEDAAADLPAATET